MTELSDVLEKLKSATAGMVDTNMAMLASLGRIATGKTDNPKEDARRTIESLTPLIMDIQDAARPLRASGNGCDVQHGNKPDTCEPVKDEMEEFFKNNPIRGQTQSFYVKLSNAIEARIMRKLGKV